MDKWEVDEHKQWSEKVRSQSFCPPLLDKKQKLRRDQIKENRNYSAHSPKGLFSGRLHQVPKLHISLIKLSILTVFLNVFPNY